MKTTNLIEPFPTSAASAPRAGAGKRRLIPGIALLAHVPVLMLLALICVFCLATGVPLSGFMRDPAAIAGINPLNGLVSDLGNMLWCVSATVCFFAAALAGPRVQVHTLARMLLFFGTLSVILLFDDFFMLHETLLPDVLGVDEKVVYVFYAVFLAWGLIRYRHALLRNRASIFLGLALLYFALSQLFDALFSEMLGPWEYLPEDGFKFLGIVFWAVFLTSTSMRVLRSESTDVKQS